MFPKIYIKLSKVEDDTDFENFLQKWESYDNFKKEYTFIFDTRNVEFVPLKYAFNMSNFILNLKNKKKQNNSVFLSKSIISSFNKNKVLQYIFPEIANPSRNFNPIMRKSKTMKRKTFFFIH